MSFTLTPAHVQGLLDPAAQGDMGTFLGALDPDVVWQLGASDQPGEGRSGVYVSPVFCR